VKSLRIGLLGYGTVGQAFARLLEAQRPRLAAQGLQLAITAVGNRGIERKRTAVPLRGDVRFTDELESVVDDAAVDLVVELMGGLSPARELLLRAFDAGKSVVTANKLLLAQHGAELAARAREHGAALGIEASVAGGIPILRAVRESFAGDTITGVSGILNGTCNFILTDMESSGRSYEEVLAEAQQLGYAEADPRSDVDGEDAAYKLVLLARMAFGQEVGVPDVRREGITRLLPCDFVYAEMLSRTPRQLATARRLPSGRLELSVRTHLVSWTSMLAKVTGPFNAVRLTAESGGDFVFYGRGAGGDPTATAVLGDVVELARSGVRPGVPTFGRERLSACTPAGLEEIVSPYALRFMVRDRPGILAALSRCLADADINIDAVFQAPFADKEALPFVITLEPIAESQLQRALESMRALPFHKEPPLAFPMTS